MEMESSLSFMTFKGSVNEAISEAKNQKKLFVVYISGDDADTSSLERFSWRSLNVVQFVSKYCIFLHLPAESADELRFSAMYAQKAIPSTTVVGFDGVKLWQHEGYIDPEDLASSLEKAWSLNLHHIRETTAKTSMSRLDGDADTSVLDFDSANDPSPMTSIEDKMEEHKRAKAEKFDHVHLKIRLVNGSSLQEKFSLTSTLHMVKEYVDSNQAADFGSYDLAIPHPRRVFDDRELSKSLSELGLFNRQTLVVVPRQRPASDGERGYFAFAKWILSYANPFAYLGAAAAASSNSDQESQSPSTGRNRTISDPDSSRSSPNRSRSVGRSGQAPATSRWGRNIHTLEVDGGDDKRFSDRNAYDNGNSTVYEGDNGEAK